KTRSRVMSAQLGSASHEFSLGCTSKSCRRRRRPHSFTSRRASRSHGSLPDSEKGSDIPACPVHLFSRRALAPLSPVGGAEGLGVRGGPLLSPADGAGGEGRQQPRRGAWSLLLGEAERPLERRRPQLPGLLLGLHRALRLTQLAQRPGQLVVTVRQGEL